ncbi:MAG: anti-sigma factor family protein [Elusimicrobiota bacterium]
MSCDKNKLNMYIDRELSSAQESEIKKHLKSCSACESFVRAVSLLRNSDKETAPEYVFESIEKKMKVSFFYSTGLKITAGGAVAAVMLIFFNFFSPNGANAEIEEYINQQFDIMFGEALVRDYDYNDFWEEGEIDSVYFDMKL